MFVYKGETRPGEGREEEGGGRGKEGLADDVMTSTNTGASNAVPAGPQREYLWDHTYTKKGATSVRWGKAGRTTTTTKRSEAPPPPSTASTLEVSVWFLGAENPPCQVWQVTVLAIASEQDSSATPSETETL